MTQWAFSDELTERLAVIEVVAEHFVGVGELEHLLVDLLNRMKSPDADRALVVAALTRLATSWPWGAPEVLEFCLRDLRWEELRAVLKAEQLQAPDFRHRSLARQVLEAYEAAWPSGEIYRTYR